MSQYYSIAIDGPAGAGKSSLAKALAARLGFLYVDTGAIYRTVGLYVARQGGDCGKLEEVLPRLPEIKLSLRHGDDGQQHMFLGAEDVTEAIRENAVSRYASQVSAHQPVRDFLLDMQRELARQHNVIMDGRDIGTVVLPNADVKVFLTAAPEARAHRRVRDLELRGQQADYDTVLRDIIARDEQDRNRPIAPLRQAEDAVLLDTTNLNLAQSLEALLAVIKEKIDL